MAVNGAGQLLVVNNSGPSLTIYDHAAAADGNVGPINVVAGPATLLDDPVALAIDTAADVLIVSDMTADALLVYEAAARAGFDGNSAPQRTITSSALHNAAGLCLASNGDLYVANGGANNILVFADAVNTNGAVAPARVVTSAAFDSIADVCLDADDRMFVVDGNGSVHSFSGASALAGAQSPDNTLEIPNAGRLTAIAVDSSGTAYVIDNALNAIYVYQNVASLNGSVQPDGTLQGLATRLDDPVRLIIVE